MRGVYTIWTGYIQEGGVNELDRPVLLRGGEGDVFYFIFRSKRRCRHTGEVIDARVTVTPLDWTVTHTVTA